MLTSKSISRNVGAILFILCFGFVGQLAAAIPTVTNVNFNKGPATGGLTVTITGTGFTGATAVDFGMTGASFMVNNDTSITATSPVHSTGPVNVTVTNSDGTSPTGPGNIFTFVIFPWVLGVSPNQGPIEGGTVVTISGFNFTMVDNVRFGLAFATMFTVNNDFSITATSPPKDPGDSLLVNVTVGSFIGTSPVTPADRFTYTEEVIVLPPSSFVGMIKSDEFLNATAYSLSSTWDPSVSPDIVLYQIFKGDTLIAEVSADSALVFATHLHSKGEAKTYQIRAVNATGIQSVLVPITIVKN